MPPPPNSPPPPLYPPLDRYQLASPRDVRFGWGVRRELPGIAAELGRRVWLVCGSRTLERSGVLAEVTAELTAAGLQVELLAMATREPTVADVDAAAARLRRAAPDNASNGTASGAGDLVAAIGGGAAIDLAKAAAALATNRQAESVLAYLEGIGRGLAIEHPPLPVIAVPTTAGTGTEATRNAVLTSLAPPAKKSLRSPRMIPAAVLLDPELTVSCPPLVTAHSGMDAVTQLIESFVSRRSNPWTAALCREGLRRALPALPIAVADGTDRAARAEMLQAAFLSGAALANSGLGLAHGVAAALGALHNIPHGLACAVMLPAAMRFNRPVCAVAFAEIGRMLDPELFGAPDDIAADSAVRGVERLCAQVGIPRTLAELGVHEAALPALVPAARGNSLNGNPRDATDADLAATLRAAWNGSPG